MVKDLFQWIIVAVLIAIVLSIVIHSDFTCSAYNVEYKNICLYLLGD